MTDERWGRVGLALWHLFPVVFDGFAVADCGTVAHEEQVNWREGRAPAEFNRRGERQMCAKCRAVKTTPVEAKCCHCDADWRLECPTPDDMLIECTACGRLVMPFEAVERWNEARAETCVTCAWWPGPDVEYPDICKRQVAVQVHPRQLFCCSLWRDGRST